MAECPGQTAARAQPMHGWRPAFRAVPAALVGNIVRQPKSVSKMKPSTGTFWRSAHRVNKHRRVRSLKWGRWSAVALGGCSEENPRKRRVVGRRAANDGGGQVRVVGGLVSLVGVAKTENAVSAHGRQLPVGWVNAVSLRYVTTFVRNTASDHARGGSWHRMLQLASIHRSSWRHLRRRSMTLRHSSSSPKTRISR